MSTLTAAADLSVELALPADPAAARGTRDYPHKRIEPTTAREVRMVIALLAACDPCSYVDSGQSPEAYGGIALDVVGRLHGGADPADLFDAFPSHVSAIGVVLFIAAVTDWWTTTTGLSSRALRNAVEAFAA